MAVVIDPTTGITAPAAAISGALSAGSIASTTEAFTNTPAVSTAQSMVRLNTANGYGSTNTKIRRFTNVVTNQGSDITYADSATNGASFTINTNGVYGISFSDNTSVGAYTIGISKNTTQPTTTIASIPIAEILCIASAAAANFTANAVVPIFLQAGDIVRAHTDGQAVGTAPVVFTITRVS